MLRHRDEFVIVLSIEQLIMENHEIELLPSTSPHHLIWFRYVDDIFSLAFDTK